MLFTLTLMEIIIQNIALYKREGMICSRMSDRPRVEPETHCSENDVYCDHSGIRTLSYCFILTKKKKVK